MLHQMLQAFGIKKSRTTAYHPQCDGMVERFNRSLLQLLRCYVNTEEDWETYLPLVLYAYRTAPHSTTGISPFQLMFGRDPKPATFPPTNAFDPSSYSACLLTKLAKLKTLWPITSPLLHNSRRTTTTRIVLVGHFQLVNQYGFQYQQHVSSSQGGRGSGQLKKL